MLNFRRSWLILPFVVLTLFLFSAPSSSRLMTPPSTADVRALAERAPLVFRGHLLNVTPDTNYVEPDARPLSIARIQVDRWYRGKGLPEQSLRFAYQPDNPGFHGHDCIDFAAGTYWIVFATEKNGPLQMIDDCEGALTISSLLGPDLPNADWPAQMEADFLAGLNDHDPAARLASIQRLGGLQLPSSREALHRVIDGPDGIASKWAVYAALRTGDVSILPKIQQLLANGEREEPEREIALQLQHVTDPAAVLGLIAILNTAKGEITRNCVLIALEELKDPRAAPSLAAHLSDPDSYDRFHALVGLMNITHEQACTLPPDWRDVGVQPQIARCKTWWEQAGKLRDWSQN
jgi:HEAT repeats